MPSTIVVPSLGLVWVPLESYMRYLEQGCCRMWPALPWFYHRICAKSLAEHHFWRGDSDLMCAKFVPKRLWRGNG